MKRTKLSSVIWWIRRAPITNRPLYWRREFPTLQGPVEVSFADHRYFSRGTTGHRFYGRAHGWPQNRIVLDVPSNGLGSKACRNAPLSHLRKVLIHEACHLAAGGPHIEALLARALRTPAVIRAAEHRILRMIPRGRI